MKNRHIYQAMKYYNNSPIELRFTNYQLIQINKNKLSFYNNLYTLIFYTKFHVNKPTEIIYIV